MAKKAVVGVFSYTSLCCAEPATKPPCERAKDDRKEGKPSQSPLGKWKCTRCRKTCKVNRTVKTKHEVLTKDGWVDGALKGSVEVRAEVGGN